jgi:hypothetical protein
MRKLKSVLPWIALASAIVAAGLLVAGSFYRKARIVDTGETRAVVERALNELLERKPLSIADQAFIDAFSRFRYSTYVSSAFLVHKDGTITGADSGDVNFSGEMMLTGTVSGERDATTGAITVVSRGSIVGARVFNVDALPHDEFSSDQLLLVAVAEAIEDRETGHDDVFATLVRTVRNPAGEPLGAIGVRYDRSPWVSAVPGFIWIVLLLGLGLSFGIYWISVPAWTFLDARDRGENARVWTAFTLIGNVIALIAYLLARAPRTAKST